MFTGGQYTIAQKVRLITDGFVVMTYKKWTGFKWFYREMVANKTSFLITFREDIISTMDVLESFPLLAHDFQFLLDSDGNIFHFDLDRAFLGTVYYKSGFRQKLMKAYDESMSLLQRMAEWSSEEGGRIDDKNFSERNLGRNVVSVLTGQLMHDYGSRYFSCRAVDILNEMQGKKRDKSITIAAKVMMAHLVQTVISASEPFVDKGGTSILSMRNCSL
ncbi:hypothetical protein ACHAWF_003397 [Thalassiosira exigua]